MAETLGVKRGERDEANRVGTGEIINGYISTIQIPLKIQQVVLTHQAYIKNSMSRRKACPMYSQLCRIYYLVFFLAVRD